MADFDAMLAAAERERKEPFFVICQTCEKRYEFLVNPDDYYDWQHGKYAQAAFPYLTADERELMISQTCGPCFNEMFPEEDEYDDA